MMTVKVNYFCSNSNYCPIKVYYKILPKKNIRAGENVLTGLGAENVVAGTQHIFKLFIV
jgi:hypothetical protein